MTLYDELCKFKNVKKHAGEFGLEVETEAKTPYEISKMSLWTIHVDDSLRGPAPYEYVLKAPLLFEKEIPQALEEFNKKISGISFDESSFTTSVHVHVNMLNEKFLTFGNFLTVYCMVENLLKKFAGPSRESNLFCLPLSDAEENFTNITYVIDRIHKKQFGSLEIDQGAAKYAALNMCAVYKYGSLEIRLLRGTTNTALIHDWLGILYSILVYSRQDITPKDIMFAWKNKGSELLSDIFGKYRKVLRYPNEEKLVEQNFWYAANIAVQIPDWRALDKEPAPKKLQSKNLDELALKVFGTTFEALTEEQKHVIIKNFKYIDGAENFNPFDLVGGPKKVKLKVAKPAPWHDEFQAVPNAFVAGAGVQFHPNFANPAGEVNIVNPNVGLPIVDPHEQPEQPDAWPVFDDEDEEPNDNF